MNSPQQSLTGATPRRLEARHDSAVLWPVDDEVPLGCECANPALQIERWRQEAPQGLQDPTY